VRIASDCGRLWNQRHLVSRRGGHRVGAGIWLEVDFPGAAGGPLRDPVIRALRLDEDVVASPSAQGKTHRASAVETSSE
jgi:hypothetical protein